MDETALGGGERHTGESGVYALKNLRGPGPNEKPGETGMEVLGGEMRLGVLEAREVRVPLKRLLIAQAFPLGSAFLVCQNQTTHTSAYEVRLCF